MPLVSSERAAPSAVRHLIILLLLVLWRWLVELVTLTWVEQRRRMRHERLLLIQDRSTHWLRRSRLRNKRLRGVLLLLQKVINLLTI